MNLAFCMNQDKKVIARQLLHNLFSGEVMSAFVWQIYSLSQ